jgi:serine O-acetyltransferase
MNFEINNISVEIKNYFQLKAISNAKGDNLHYSFYLYRNNEIVEKVPYSKENEHIFNLEEKGTYSVRAFIKNTKEKKALTSQKVKFQGFNDKGIENIEPKIVIFGVSKIAAALKLILETEEKVSFFIDLDSNKWGGYFFGLEVISPEKLSMLGDYKVIVADNINQVTLNELNNYSNGEIEIFNESVYESNEVLKVLDELNVMKLYGISRKCFQNGLIRGANYIKGFIHHKFNSIVPYTAEIGEGTRLGYGGIGVVIHSKAVIGKNCTVSQNVTIGSRGVNPIIGDNVFIAPGSKCIGGKIGNNVVIGANSVVLKEIPDNCVVAGVPAKIISTDIAKYNKYIIKK